jgi:hypothetical protein
MLYPFRLILPSAKLSWSATLRRAIWLGALWLACVTPASAQTPAAVDFSIQAIDKYLESIPTNQTVATLGDMLVSVDKLVQWRDILKAKKSGFSTAGAFDFSFGAAWPGGVVPYAYQTTGTNAMPANKIAMFENGMREWQKVASINFVPRTTEANYLLIKYTGDAPGAPMNSFIGMLGGMQVLNVAGWGNTIDCAHELGHALGMTHEQSRPDRDTFVTLYPTNMSVNPVTDVNYAIVPSTLMRSAYDYDSLMHYPRTAKAKSPGLITMTANPPNQIWSDGAGPQEIGQKDHLSSGDRSSMGAQYGSPLAIRGRIADAGARGLGGVLVSIGNGSVYRGSTNTYTDSNGNFEFAGIPQNSGTYRITPIQLGFSFNPSFRDVALTTADGTGTDFTQPDTAPPTLVISNPVPSGIFTSSPLVNGSASDNVGIKEVRVALARTADLMWWNWNTSSFDSTSFSFANHYRVATGTNSWSLSLPTLPDGGYQVHVQSVDTADVGSSWLYRHFFVDSTPPTLSIQLPAHNSTITVFYSLRGTASDGTGSGIATNKVFFTIYQDGDFWTGIHWKSGTTAQDPEVLLSTEVVAGEWYFSALPEGPDARTGQYAVSAFTRDNAGNLSVPVGGVTSSIFNVDRDPPTVSITGPADGSLVTNLTQVTGIANDNQGVADVRYYIYRFSDGKFWDGSSWGGGGPADRPTTYNSGTHQWASTGSLPTVGPSVGNQLTDGSYNFIAIAYDNAGQTNRADVVVTVVDSQVYVWHALANGNWSTPTNWVPAGVPDSNDRAFINWGGSLNLGGSFAVGELNLDGGLTLRNGTLNVGTNPLFPGLLNWTNAHLNCTLNIATGAVVNLRANGQINLDSSVLDNAGTVTITGNGNLVNYYGSVIRNSGVFVLQDGVRLEYSGYGTVGQFTNSPGGILRRGTTLGTNSFSYFQLNNAGQVDIQSGVISLVAETHPWWNGSSVSGAGRLRLDGTTLNLNGTTTLTDGTLELAAGTLGGTGMFDGFGTFVWSGGSLGGMTTVNTNATVNITGAADKGLGGTKLVNRGTGTWTGTGNIVVNYDGGMTNSSSGTFTINTDAGFVFGGYGSIGMFHNDGTLTKSGGTGTNSVTTAFNNLGAVNISVGSLAFSGGGIHSGTFTPGASQTLHFSGGSHRIDANTTFAGGRSRVVGGALAFNHTNAAQSATLSGTLELVAGGAFTGTGRLQGGGTFNWTGGGMDNGILTLGSSLVTSATGANDKGLSTFTLVNNGTLQWPGSGNLIENYGSVITNNAVLELQGNAAFVFGGYGAGGTLVNSPTATLRRNGANGTNTLSGFVLLNTGVLDVQSGVLSLTGPPHALNDGGRVQGAGRVRVDGAAATLNGTNTLATGGTVELASGSLGGTGTFSGGGTFNWSGGSLAGTTTVAPDSFLQISSANDKAMSGTVLVNAGTGTWTGNGNIIVNYGGSITNSGSLALDTDAGLLFGGYGAVGTLQNSGSLVKSSGTLTNVFSIAINNSGSVAVGTGGLTFNAGGYHSGSFQADAGRTIHFTAGDHTLANGVSITGAGRSRIVGGSVTLANTGTNGVTVTGSFELAPGGTLAGTGRLMGGGLFDWSGGVIANANITLAPNLSTTLTGAGDRLIYSAALTHTGNLLWTGAGNLVAYYGSVITNSGVFELQGAAGLYFSGYGSPGTLINQSTGTLRRSGAAGTNVFNTFGLENHGAIDIQSGVLSLPNHNHTLNNGGSVGGTGRMRIDGAGITLNGATTLGSGGTLELASGSLGGGAFGGTGTFNWTGGSLSGTTTINPGANLLISGAASKGFPSAVLVNNGNAVWTGGDIIFYYGSVLTNGGTWTIQSDAAFAFSGYGSPGAVVNALGATLRKNTATGATTFGSVDFQNAGTIELETGVLNLAGDFSPQASSVLRVPLGGTGAGTNFGRLSLPGTANFSGGLTVILTNSFAPTNGHSFVLANYAARTGQLAPVILPSLPNQLAWKLNYGASALTLQVQFATLIENLARLSNGQFQFTINGPTASACIIETSTNLTTWTSVFTNSPFNGTINFNDPDAAGQPKRFYRISIVE